MIFLEQTVNQIINEEGQLIISLSDLNVTWEKLERLFVGTYEQAKGYISIYDWDNHVIGQNLQKYDGISHIRHLSYTTGYIQRYMPDVPPNYWEYNPYTNKAASLMNTNFSLEVGKYPTCSQLEYQLDLGEVKKGTKYSFVLPFTPSSITTTNDEYNETFNIDIKEVTAATVEDFENKYLELHPTRCLCCSDNNLESLQFTGSATGSFDPVEFTGDLTFTKDYDNLSLIFTSKYVGIKELDLTCELFYTWFKGNMLTMLGRIKKQIDLSQSGLPFDLSQDGLLERGTELMTKVEELKGTKSHWSNF